MNEREEMRRIILLAKILAVLMAILIIVELFSCSREVKAAVITGEKQLGGGSLIMQMVIEKEHGIEDIDLELLEERMKYMGWKKSFDAYVHNAEKLGVEKIYKNIKTIKVDKVLGMIDIYMENGSSVAVDASKHIISIRMQQKWRLMQ